MNIYVNNTVTDESDLIYIVVSVLTSDTAEDNEVDIKEKLSKWF